MCIRDRNRMCMWMVDEREELCLFFEVNIGSELGVQMGLEFLHLLFEVAFVLLQLVHLALGLVRHPLVVSSRRILRHLHKALPYPEQHPLSQGFVNESFGVF
eukprot:TRINITY_DN12441_c0_g1_i5.p2 TRINITY_DN12441_c0_g1~~TRINITY_DN12441_c0_g1_i5.p2  ORF type:complete len:102 (+),score=5.98 TRINITY_DN12441_c0_g1_i5:67-372(+)